MSEKESSFTKLKIGTCGFGMSKDQYASNFLAVEVQQTFYQPPQIKTLEKWRAQVSDNFEFAIKAWQLVKHEAKSPTYKRLKQILTDEEKETAGYFKPTAIVQAAWETTRACAAALKAKTILFQCPASFKQTRENIKNLTKFFSVLDRGNLKLAWEPRGAWDSQTVKSICSNLGLWYAVDPFAQRTETPRKVYYRLHGRNGFRYKYEEDELTELAALLPEDKIAYIFFNNRFMIEDALVFKSQVIEKEANW